MVLSYWKKALVGVLASTGLALGQAPVSTPAQPAERVITVREEGKPGQRCKVIKSWKTVEGNQAYQVQALETGEMITIVAQGAPGGKGAVNTTIYHWGIGKTTPPKEAPLPPAETVQAAPLTPPPAPTPATKVAQTGAVTSPRATIPSPPPMPVPPPPVPVKQAEPKPVVTAPAGVPAPLPSRASVAPAPATQAAKPGTQKVWPSAFASRPASADPAPVAAAPTPILTPVLPPPAPVSPPAKAVANPPTVTPPAKVTATLPVTPPVKVTATPPPVTPSVKVTATPPPVLPPVKVTATPPPVTPAVKTPAGVPAVARKPASASPYGIVPAASTVPNPMPPGTPATAKPAVATTGQPTPVKPAVVSQPAPAAAGPAVAQVTRPPGAEPLPLPAPSGPPGVEAPKVAAPVAPAPASFGPNAGPPGEPRPPRKPFVDKVENTLMPARKHEISTHRAPHPHEAAGSSIFIGADVIKKIGEESKAKPPEKPENKTDKPSAGAAQSGDWRSAWGKSQAAAQLDLPHADTRKPDPLKAPEQARKVAAAKVTEKTDSPGRLIDLPGRLIGQARDMAPGGRATAASPPAEVRSGTKPIKSPPREEAVVIAVGPDVVVPVGPVPQGVYPGGMPAGPPVMVQPMPMQPVVVTPSPMYHVPAVPVVMTDAQMPAGVPGVAELMMMLKDSLYPSQREWAADKLSATDWRLNPQVADALAAAAKDDPAATVRAGCVRGLVKMKANTASVLGALEALKADADPRVQKEVGQALAALFAAPTPDVRPAGAVEPK